MLLTLMAALAINMANTKSTMYIQVTGQNVGVGRNQRKWEVVVTCRGQVDETSTLTGFRPSAKYRGGVYATIPNITVERLLPGYKMPISTRKQYLRYALNKSQSISLALFGHRIGETNQILNVSIKTRIG